MAVDLNKFRTLESILEIIKSKQKFVPQLKELLEVYNRTYEDASVRLENNEKTHPVIVFEGLDGAGKSTIVKILSKKVMGKLYRTPPDSIAHLRSTFNCEEPELRLLYYCIGNYIAANEISILRCDQPVIVDRFWHSTFASALANQVGEDNPLPPEGSEVYKWPDDLLKPDVSILLTVPEKMRIERLSRRTSYSAEEDRLKNDDFFRNTLLSAYNRMHDPKMEPVKSIKYPKPVTNDIIELLKERGTLSDDIEA